QASAFTRAAKRDTLREAVFLWITPFCAARMISGCAARSAVSAADLSPLAIASSTLRTKVRMRLRRSLLTSVFFAITRIAFFADFVFAIDLRTFVSLA